MSGGLPMSATATCSGVCGWVGGGVPVLQVTMRIRVVSGAASSLQTESGQLCVNAPGHRQSLHISF